MLRDEVATLGASAHRAPGAQGTDPTIDRPALRRALVLSVLALFEGISSSLLVADVQILQEDRHPLALVLVLKAFRVAAVGAPVLLLILSRRVERVLADLDLDASYAWRRWFIAHLAVFGALAMTLWSAGSRSTPPGWPITLLALSLACSALVFLLFAAAPPRGWLRFARNHWHVLLISVVAGYGLRRFVIETPEIWQTQAWELSALATLQATHFLLSFLYPEVVLHPPDVLSIGTFAIQVFGPCSGIEGMLLMGLFTLVYLVLFRNALRFPRALLLLPLGMGVMWITNVLRITALFVIGASLSEDIAVRGFHSYAGWIAFSSTAVLLIAVAHRFLHHASAQEEPTGAAAYRPAAAFALLVPLVVMLGSSTVASAFSSDFAAWYPLVILLTAVAMWCYRKEYATIVQSPSPASVLVGGVVFIGWLVSESSLAPDQPPAELQRMPVWAANFWIVTRVIGSVIIVPIVEELAFRGYLLRKLVGLAWERVPPGQFSWFSFIGSSLLFGLLHDRWIAGTLAGAAFALALYRKGRLADAIVAHVIANGLIAVWVLAFGRWSLWA
jgi:exosortase E/protease (VPEID-CTERM system)